MNKLIARLIDTGMPRDVAVSVCKSFLRDSIKLPSTSTLFILKPMRQRDEQGFF